ncbi:MAG: hypothetical protein U0586_16315 [Candidatus Brocadiaceae bacterium]
MDCISTCFKSLTVFVFLVLFQGICILVPLLVVAEEQQNNEAGAQISTTHDSASTSGKEGVTTPTPSNTSPATVVSEKSCSELISFRDNELFQQWRNARHRVSLSSALSENFKQSKQDLIDENKWNSSTASLNFGMSMVAIKTTCDLIMNLSSFSEEYNNTAKGIKSIYSILKAGGSIEEIRTQTMLWMTSYFSDKVKKVLSPVITTARTVKGLVDNIQILKDMPTDFKAYRQELYRQVTNLEQSIGKYEQQMEESSEAFAQINAYKNDIDRYLREFCPNAESDKLSKEKAKERLDRLAELQRKKREAMRDLNVNEYLSDANSDVIKNREALAEEERRHRENMSQFTSTLMNMQSMINSQGFNSTGGYGASGYGSSASPEQCAQMREQIRIDREALAKMERDGAIYDPHLPRHREAYNAIKQTLQMNEQWLMQNCR